MTQLTKGRERAAIPAAPIRVGLVFAAFPADDLTPYKYFLLLLNRLQKTIQLEIFDIQEGDDFIAELAAPLIDADKARDGLTDCGDRIKRQIVTSGERFDLANVEVDQLIIVSGATLSDYHYLIRRGSTTLLALGEWEKGMAPPSLAEFLQLLVLRAVYSATEGHVWNGIHLGNRACIFDFTENLENTRLMALAEVGVCADCESALLRDGLWDAPCEIRHVVSRAWRGERTLPGTPTNIMGRLGYDLFLTKGFEPTWRERLRQVMSEDGIKEFIKFVFAVALAYMLFALGLKK